RSVLSLSHAGTQAPRLLFIMKGLTEGGSYVHWQQTYDLGGSPRLQRQLHECRSMQHGKPRCGIRECPGLYRTNDWFHSDRFQGACADVCDEQGLGEYCNVLRRRKATDAEPGYRCGSIKGDQARAL